MVYDFFHSLSSSHCLSGLHCTVIRFTIVRPTNSIENRNDDTSYIRFIIQNFNSNCESSNMKSKKNRSFHTNKITFNSENVMSQ